MMNRALNLRTRLLCCVFAAAALLALAGRAAAQTAVEEARVAAEVAKITEGLQPQSQAVIQRLTTLRQLSSGNWKTHAGDLAHGEAIGLDESSWQPIAE